MIPRYTRPEMGRIFSDENRFAQWLAVELAASEALAETGEVPASRRRPARPRRLRRRPHPRNRARGQARRHRLHHRRRREHGRRRPCRRFALAALRADLERRCRYRAGPGAAAGFRAVARGRDGAWPHRSNAARGNSRTPSQIGRTHGIHAEPITFGLKLALWYDEMRRNIARLEAAAEDLRVGKISGAVGHLRPHRARSRGKDLRAPWPEARRHRQPGDLAATGTRLGLRRWRCSRPRSKRSRSKSATSSAPRCGKRRSRSARGRRAPRRCPTSAIR